MGSPRFAFFPLAAVFVAVALSFPAAGQSVISTHSGVVYFFEGSVFLGNQPLQQSFGKFPDIGEGGELRTEHGRAEVLLTPGSFLRIGDNSAIRMVSTSLADTRVALLHGSAILESREPTDTPPVLIYQGWQVHLPRPGIYRLDAQPAQVTVNKGEVEVAADNNPATVDVKEGEVLPLQAVLVTEAAPPDQTDDFDKWAMGRSQAIYADNATAAEIFDEPQTADPSGLAFGGFSQFPITGIPSLGIGNPYGLSFWSPFQPGLNSLYMPVYQYAPLFLGYGYAGYVPGLRYPTLPRTGFTLPSTLGGRYPSYGVNSPPYGVTSPRFPSPGTIRTAPRMPAIPPHIGGHVGGHR